MANFVLVVFNVITIILKVVFFPVDLLWDLWRTIKFLYIRAWGSLIKRLDCEQDRLMNLAVIERLKDETNMFLEIGGIEERL